MVCACLHRQSASNGRRASVLAAYLPNAPFSYSLCHYYCVVRTPRSKHTRTIRAYICVHIYIYVYICTYIYIYTYVGTHIYVSRHTCIHAYWRTCMPTFIHSFIHVSIYMYGCIGLFACFLVVQSSAMWQLVILWTFVTKVAVCRQEYFPWHPYSLHCSSFFCFNHCYS